MELELAGKRALITGASRGIGRAIAETLSLAGCRIAINARGSEALSRAALALGGAICVAGDVSDASEARRVVGESMRLLGGLDVLVCNVGGGQSLPPGQETEQEWQRVFALNLWSATNTVAAARDALRATRGCIVCISSICGSEVIPGAPITYSAAKAALHSFVRGIARPLGIDGVRINAVAPGNILFEGSVWERKLATDPGAVAAMLQSDVPVGRLGTPHEVAGLVAYLVSDRAGFATGQIWTLDGGQVRR
jgi:3-oxoacyl-[acyl-carrier protein] reductase